MVRITQERVEKLDTLYDVLGENSPVIARIKGDVESINTSKKDAESKKAEHENQKTRLQTELENFTFEAAAFQDKFSGLDNSSYTSLKAIGIDIKFGDVHRQLSEAAPKYKEQLESQIAEEGEIIELTSDEVAKYAALLDDEKAKLVEKETVIAQINNVIEDILVRKNDSYSPKHVKELLDKLGVFPEEDIIILGSLILFPESGLQEYVAEYRDRTREEQTVSDIENVVATMNEPKEETKIEEQKEVTVNDEEKEPETVQEGYDFTKEETEVEEDKIQEIKAFTEETEEDNVELSINDNSETTKIPDIQMEFEEKEPVISFDEEPKNIEDVEIDINLDEPTTIESFLESINLSIEKFEEYNSKAKALEILNNTDKNLIVTNYEILRSINVSEDVIYVVTDDMYMCLADSELGSKINLLRSKGISDHTIKNDLQNITKRNCYLKESLNTIKERIAVIESKFEKLTEDNVSKVYTDVVNLRDNLRKLAEAGIELDEKDERNYGELLTNSTNISEDLEVLKDYTIRLVRKNNGKYALGVFWKDPYDVMTSIDALIEFDLEDLIEDNVEVLGKNILPILQRVKYCQENEIPIGEDGKYYTYITDPRVFEIEIGQVELPELCSLPSITEEIGAFENNDYANLLIQILDEVYEDKSKYQLVKFEEVEKNEKYQEIKEQIISVLNAKPTGKNTYKVGDAYLSKVKIERNIAILVNRLLQNGENIDDVAREIIITSALYNTFAPVDKLQAAFGQTNLENNVGGLSL